MLEKTQRDRFFDHGYLLVEQILQDDDTQPVVDEYNDCVDRLATALLADGRIDDTCADESFGCARGPNGVQLHG